MSIDLNQLVGIHVADRMMLAEKRGLSLVFEGQPDLLPILGDEGLLSQVLSILLTNALNFTPEGGLVTVSTHSQAKQDQLWVGFRVKDTGPGISPDEQNRLFERFFRGQAARAARVPGTGLGLALAKEIIKRHDGYIDVESTGVPGEGTAFSVWLLI
jgi:signal transduction histidine kinase